MDGREGNLTVISLKKGSMRMLAREGWRGGGAVGGKVVILYLDTFKLNSL